MEEENGNAMNLDLNLGPLDNSSDGGSYPNVALNLEEWLDDPDPVHRVREVVRQRNHRWLSLWRQLPETRSLAVELLGEGSERPLELSKISEKATGLIEDQDVGKKKDVGKSNGDEGSFFDCHICLDLAKDPVVTCCGHLFCWPCLYQWLHHHSDAKECPVCKGEVTIKTVTPIYGRGNGVREPDDVDSSLKIPLRPHARRIESWRQTLQRTATAFTIPMEEMFRRLGNAIDLNQELSQMHPRDSPERANVLLNRLLMRRERTQSQTPILPPDVIDLTESIPTSYEMRDRDASTPRLTSMLLRRASSHRVADHSLAAVESYFQSNAVVDDRDSLSSIAAVIHSESQTVDNAVEIDSTVALSTSSSRRRNDASRVSDVDSGESRAPRRRRLN